MKFELTGDYNDNLNNLREKSVGLCKEIIAQKPDWKMCGFIFGAALFNGFVADFFVNLFNKDLKGTWQAHMFMIFMLIIAVIDVVYTKAYRKPLLALAGN